MILLFSFVSSHRHEAQNKYSNQSISINQCHKQNTLTFIFNFYLGLYYWKDKRKYSLSYIIAPKGFWNIFRKLATTNSCNQNLWTPILYSPDKSHDINQTIKFLRVYRYETNNNLNNQSQQMNNQSIQHLINRNPAYKSWIRILNTKLIWVYVSTQSNKQIGTTKKPDWLTKSKSWKNTT